MPREEDAGTGRAGGGGGGGGGRLGKVFSFEYHEHRFRSLSKEIDEHGLAGVVRVTLRDVYGDGFALEDGEDICADAVFLDLPAPWYVVLQTHLIQHVHSKKTNGSHAKKRRALPHLSRHPAANGGSCVLNPHATVSLCSFSPCIEQAQRTVSTLRDLGWVGISMSELRHKFINVRRERVGLQEEGLRGVNSMPATVEEAVARLRELDSKAVDFMARRKRQNDGVMGSGSSEVGPEIGSRVKSGPGSRQERLKSIQEAAKNRKLYKEGRLVHRTEQELKTHTSYLVFAVLPREWTDEDEAKCLEECEIGSSPRRANAEALDLDDA
jgi:tRNA (adenine57-N1/adenine58-N1)-methyltransferase